MSVASALHAVRRELSRPNAALAGLLADGLLLRLWLIPKGAFLPDILQWKSWSEQLAAEPLSSFYRIANPPTNRLPPRLPVRAGDRRIVCLVRLIAMVGPDRNGPSAVALDGVPAGDRR